MRLSPPSAGTIVRTLIGVGAIGGIFYFLGRGLASNWDDLRSEDISVQPALLIASGAFLAADIVLRSAIWADLVDYFTGGRRPSFGRLMSIFLYSWVGRYVPGKVAYVVGRFYLGRASNVATPPLLGSIAYETILLTIGASALVSLTLMPSLAVESESVLPFLFIPAIAIGGVLALQPAIVRFGLHTVLRVLGRDAPGSDWFLPASRMARTIGLYMIVFSLSGFGFYLMTVSVTPYSARYIPFAMGAMTLAGLAGLITVITPAGIGVREGVLVGLLQFTMPLELAIVVSLVARIWATAVDLIVVVACFVYDYVWGDRILLAALRGSGEAEPKAVSS